VKRKINILTEIMTGMMTGSNVFSDSELKQYLKNLGVNVLNILHQYRQGSDGFCTTCDYYVSRCWLCDQCVSCCKLTEEENETIQSYEEERKDHFKLNNILVSTKYILMLSNCGALIACLDK